VAELGYEFVAGMVRDNVGNEGKAYFPFILTLFVFILFCNTLGLVPYSFTPTSHIIVTFAMALIVFVGVTIIGFAKHGLHFLQLFAPKGVPVYFLVFVAPLEVFSYFVRPFSLSIRLFANMLAGHTMLKVFGGFAVMLGILAGWAPIVLIFALTGLELIIAFLQAYVFTILTCLYLHDALHPSH
jgi:F-type H+-transporting ATPase subunit a